MSGSKKFQRSLRNPKDIRYLGLLLLSLLVGALTLDGCGAERPDPVGRNQQFVSAWNANAWNANIWNSNLWNANAWNSNLWNSNAWNSTVGNSLSWNSNAWNSNLWNANAWNSNVWNANAWNANVWNANAWNSNLWNANIWNSNAWNANVWNANIWNANIWNANVWNANAWNANVWNANVWNSNLWNSASWNANIWNANIWNANAWNANVWNSNVWNANLWNANVWNSNLWNANAWDSTDWTSVGSWLENVCTSQEKCDYYLCQDAGGSYGAVPWSTATDLTQLNDAQRACVAVTLEALAFTQFAAMLRQLAEQQEMSFMYWTRGACKDGVSKVFRLATGKTVTFPGYLGLATDWCERTTERGPDPRDGRTDEQQLLTGFLMASSNTSGISNPFNLIGSSLASSDDLDAWMPYPERSYFGNVFDGSGAVGICDWEYPMFRGGLQALGRHKTLRGAFIDTGYCNCRTQASCSDGSGRGPNSQCAANLCTTNVPGLNNSNPLNNGYTFYDAAGVSDALPPWVETSPTITWNGGTYQFFSSRLPTYWGFADAVTQPTSNGYQTDFVLANTTRGNFESIPTFNHRHTYNLSDQSAAYGGGPLSLTNTDELICTNSADPLYYTCGATAALRLFDNQAIQVKVRPQQTHPGRDGRYGTSDDQARVYSPNVGLTIRIRYRSVGASSALRLYTGSNTNPGATTNTLVDHGTINFPDSWDDSKVSLSGTGANIGYHSTYSTGKLTVPGMKFTPVNVGRILKIAGATNAQLNGYFTIIGVGDANDGNYTGGDTIYFYTGGANQTEPNFTGTWKISLAWRDLYIGNLYVNSDYELLVRFRKMTGQTGPYLGGGIVAPIPVQSVPDTQIRVCANGASVAASGCGEAVKVAVVVKKNGGTYGGTGTVSDAVGGIACGGAVSMTGCTELYNPGTQVMLTATPDPYSYFVRWESGPCGGMTTPSCGFTPTEDVLVTAKFEKYRYTVSPTMAGNGVGTVSMNPSGGTYSAGTVVTLTAAATSGQPWAVGSSFSSWSNGCTGSSNPCVLTVTGNLSPRATFTANPATFIVNRNSGAYGGQGRVTGTGIDCGTVGLPGTDCSEPVAYGGSVTLTASAWDQNSYFAGWSGPCTGTNPTCTLSNITSTSVLNVVAAFEKYRPFISATNSSLGRISTNPVGISCGNGMFSCGQYLVAGTTLTITAAPASGKTFVGWTSGCSGTANPCTYVVPQGSQTISATFQ